MFERISRGWKLTKASWSVLKAHPKLLLLPLCSGIAILSLLAVIAYTSFAGSTSASHQGISFSLNHKDPLVYAALFAFYLSCTIIGVFFNAALVFCAMQGFAGKTPSLRSGLSTALGRLPQILAWSLVASTVGVALNALQNLARENLGFLGSIFGAIVEVAWAAVTYFVVPVLVVEGVGPIAAVKRSSSVLRQTWGETAASESGLGAISFLFFLPIVLLVGAAAAIAGATGQTNATSIIALAAVLVPYLLVLTVVFSALGTIFQTSAYIYATTGTAPGSIDPALLRSAFKKK